MSRRPARLGARRRRCSGSTTSTISAGSTRCRRTSSAGWCSTGSCATRQPRAGRAGGPTRSACGCGTGRRCSSTAERCRRQSAARPGLDRGAGRLSGRHARVPLARQPPARERDHAEAALRLPAGPAVARWERRGRLGARGRARRAVPAGRRPLRALADVPRAARFTACSTSLNVLPDEDERASGSWQRLPAHPALPLGHAPSRRRDRALQRRRVRDRAARRRAARLRRPARLRGAGVRPGLLSRDGLSRLSRGRRLPAGGRGADRSGLPPTHAHGDIFSYRAEPRRPARGGRRRHLDLRERETSGTGSAPPAPTTRSRSQAPTSAEFFGAFRVGDGAGRATCGARVSRRRPAASGGTTATGACRDARRHRRELRSSRPRACSSCGTPSTRACRTTPSQRCDSRREHSRGSRASAKRRSTPPAWPARRCTPSAARCRSRMDHYAPRSASDARARCSRFTGRRARLRLRPRAARSRRASTRGGCRGGRVLARRRPGRDGASTGLKIVLLTHYFWPEPGAPSARLLEMGREWAARGTRSLS